MKIAAGRPRKPGTAIERHAARALLHLADLDPDKASQRNDEGFSAADVGKGHWLAGMIRDTGRLTNYQWDTAKRLAHRYRRQVGEPTCDS